MRSSSIVLLSGGLDSLVSLHWASKESDLVMGMTFAYGQRSEEKEIQAAERICRHYDIQHKVVSLPWYALLKRSALVDSAQPLPELSSEDLDNPVVTLPSAQAVWIPNRNGVFLNVAASIAEDRMTNWLVVGFNQEEAKTFADNSEAFVKTANEFFKYSTQGKVRVQAPMGGKTKREIVLWGLKNGIDFSLVWSCYRGDEKMCGHCESCLRLKRAFIENEATDWIQRLF